MATIESSIKTELYKEALDNRGIFKFSRLEALANTHRVDTSTLFKLLLEAAADFAVPPISQFYVGALAIDKVSQQVFLGANLEFNQQALSLVVHAEQAAINNAWLNGAHEISEIIINAAPCGYCRQFMNELSTSKSLKVHLPSGETTLTALLPHSFGPEDLGNKETLFNSPKLVGDKNAVLEEIDKVLFDHYLQSYVPYSKNSSAVEIKLANGQRFYGRYAENAAYSPSLSPLQSALSQLALTGKTLDQVEVESIKLVEKKGCANQKQVSLAVLASYHLQDKLTWFEIE
ncbi:cytidine deaminase (plasmid) [Pseudoalteromonas sp. T1lg65]|uniref:cytidine deaminase n=1 Tax=Pseudoalteromonas sp. T1lg65 TaxID=2077101 RepID=UPI003F7A59AF